MQTRAFKPGVVGLSALVACLAASPSPAIAETTTTCTEPVLSQPFLAFGDENWYSLAPGESYDSFAGSGWTLSGGAKIATTTLYDGTQGYVLELPTSAQAVSPATCVNNSYPYLRTIVRSSSGGGAKISIAYETASGWGGSKATGEVKSTSTTWQLSNKIKVETGPYTGWHLAQFTLVGTGKSAHAQIYNFYLDPRMR
jgi:hypothetical protein